MGIRWMFSGMGLAAAGSLLVALPSVMEEGCDDGSEAGPFLVGAQVLTILPEVDGSTAYFDPLRQAPLALEPGDPGTDPGVFVEQFDVGTIAVGNGYPSAHWVHDELRTGAIAFKNETDPSGKTIILATVDVYMLFRQDIQIILDKVKARVGEERFATFHIMVASTHTHMGPDTSGLDGINRDYFDYMTDQVAKAIVDASDQSHMTSARMRVAQTAHQFGMGDGISPRLVDPTLHVLQAVREADGSPIASVMVWPNHPEDVLWFGRDVYATEAQAEFLRSIDECYSDDAGASCHIEGQYLSAGFPGYAVSHVQAQTGAPALYFNGPLGSMISPLNTLIWETEGPTGQPAGDGVVIPVDAVLLDKSFRALAVNGIELGKRALEALTRAEEVLAPSLEAEVRSFYTRLNNWGFRLGLSVKKNGEPVMLGYLKRELFTCPLTGTKDDQTCVSDQYESQPDPILKAPVRVGDHIKTEVHYLRIGPVGIITIPGESVTENIEGLPSDFLTDPRSTYYTGGDQDGADHVQGQAYQTSGYIRQAMPDPYKWAIGLAMDEVGYLVPLSDWRIFCVADDETFGGSPGTCAEMRAKGIVDYTDADGKQWSLSGARCKTLIESPSVLQQPPYTLLPNGGELALRSCLYGQAFGEPDGHYCETMGASWDVTPDWVRTASEVLGWTQPLDQINPSYIGQNQVE